MEGKGGRRQWRTGLPPFVVRMLYPALLRHRSGRGTAAPWIKVRHCHAKIGGAAEPCHISGQRFRSPPRQPCRAAMHGVAQAFSRARAICAAKCLCRATLRGSDHHR